MEEWVRMQCPSCGVRYCLDQVFHDYRKRGGLVDGKMANWHCPNGHVLVFTENELDKTRRERDRLKQQMAQKDDEIAGLQRQFKRIEKRTAAGVCPCCNRTFKQLAAHMRSKHPEMAPKIKAVK